MRGGRKALNVDTNRLTVVCVSGAILGGVGEVAEGERLSDLESLMVFWSCRGNGTGVNSTARKKRFIAKDMATVCRRRRNAHKWRMFHRRPVTRLARALKHAHARLTFNSDKYRPCGGAQKDLLTPPIPATPFYNNLSDISKQGRVLQPSAKS